MNNLAAYFARVLTRWIPDALTVAVLLTLLVLGLAVGFTESTPMDVATYWGDGIWNLLTFTMQISLTFLFGFVFANTPIMRATFEKITRLINNASSAYIVAVLTSAICSLFSWALGLVAAGLIARIIGEACQKKGIKVHYPLLAAAGMSGIVVWHQGLTGTVGLTIATPGHFLENQIGIINFADTVLTWWNGAIVLAVLVSLPFFMARLHPHRDDDISEAPSSFEDVEVSETNPHERTPAERLDDSRILVLLVVGLIGVALWIHFFNRGLGVELNILNLFFLAAGLLCAGSLGKFIAIVSSSGRIIAPIILQYPFYAGIAGVMGNSGLADVIASQFVAIATAETLPFFAFLCAGMVNIFVPSGGGQWVVQGPIMMSAATQLGADIPRTAMAVAVGDQWTNLIQPLIMLPVLTISGLKMREMAGYCLMAALWVGAIFGLAMLLL